MRKKDYLTFISVISAIAVLTLHTNGCFWKFSATERYWKTANVIESVFYFAVPLFFMISGITLMDFYDRYTLKQFFVKRFKRTVIPFIAWSLIGLLCKVIIGEIPTSNLNLRYVYQGIVNNTFIKIFWFFTSLFMLYLSMPLFAAVEKSKRKEVFIYLVLSGLIFNVFCPFLFSNYFSELSFPYRVNVVTGVLIWPPLGWLLDSIDFRKIQRIIIYLLSFSGLLIHMIGTYVLSMQKGEIVGTFKGYQNFPSVFYAVGVYILLKEIGKKIMVSKFANFINWIGKYTFSIYLLQFLFLHAFPRLPFVNTRSIVYRLGAPFIIIPIIIVMTFCLRKIPYIKMIVP